MGSLSPCPAIPAELEALRHIAARPDAPAFPAPSVRVLLRHIAWQDDELARLRRLVENRPGVVVRLRIGAGDE